VFENLRLPVTDLFFRLQSLQMPSWWEIDVTSNPGNASDSFKVNVICGKNTTFSSLLSPAITNFLVWKRISWNFSQVSLRRPSFKLISSSNISGAPIFIINRFEGMPSKENEWVLYKKIGFVFTEFTIKLL
jgi:hypothetical protein